jgi:hypothetical protein
MGLAHERAQLERKYASFVSIVHHHLPYNLQNPAHHLSPPANTIFGPFFEVPVTSFARPRDRKITGLVRVYATPETKCWLLATFCSRILLIWQSGSVIFRNSQLFWGVQETRRSQLSHFENSWKPKPPKVPRTILGAFWGSPSQVLCGRLAERLPGQ